MTLTVNPFNSRFTKANPWAYFRSENGQKVTSLRKGPVAADDFTIVKISLNFLVKGQICQK